MKSINKERIATILVISATVAQFVASILDSRVQHAREFVMEKLVSLNNANTEISKNSTLANQILQYSLACKNYGLNTTSCREGFDHLKSSIEIGRNLENFSNQVRDQYTESVNQYQTTERGAWSSKLILNAIFLFASAGAIITLLL